ncbi:MAG: choice-of-anchor Q domain-containing protein [SAR202 cluster bacterium]|nr:choice-of-anchor Q domain-containing protein [SAR202 cluster bacterium]
MLGPLADNGCTTLTHEPLAGSPAIDNGNDASCQRPTSAGSSDRETVTATSPCIATSAQSSFSQQAGHKMRSSTYEVSMRRIIRAAVTVLIVGIALGASSAVALAQSPDTTAPTITPTVTGTLGANGWHTSNGTISWQVNDPESHITIPSLFAGGRCRNSW